MSKKINQVAIAEQVGVTETFVSDILNNRRNPNTAKGMEVVLSAATQYAEQCKAEYVAAAIRRWKLNKTLNIKTTAKKRGVMCTDNYENVTFFESVKEANRVTGVSIINIYSHIRRNSKSKSGYKFKYER